MMYLRTLFLLILFSTRLSAYDFAVLADQHIVPRYQALADATASLVPITEEYCKAPQPLALKTLRGQFRKAFLRWQAVQHLRFGPIQYLSRNHRFQLWPDKRGTVSRHLARFLADPPWQNHKAFELHDKSIAIQGFSALEQLLFRAPALDDRECRLALLIAANLRDMARAVLRDWTQGPDNYRRFFITPGDGNDIFESEAELAGQLLNSLHTELELMLAQKLGRPLGGSLNKARGKRSEAWRSGSSVSALAENLQACRSLYRIGFAPDVAEAGLDRRIESAFEHAGAALQQISLPLHAAVSDSNTRPQVEALRTELSRLKQLVANDLASALQLSLGFNSLDGD